MTDPKADTITIPRADLVALLDALDDALLVSEEYVGEPDYPLGEPTGITTGEARALVERISALLPENDQYRR